MLKKFLRRLDGFCGFRRQLDLYYRQRQKCSSETVVSGNITLADPGGGYMGS